MIDPGGYDDKDDDGVAEPRISTESSKWAQVPGDWLIDSGVGFEQEPEDEQ